jgi:hypothetical protein
MTAGGLNPMAPARALSPRPHGELRAMQARAERLRRPRDQSGQPAPRRVRISLWIPVTLVFALLAPFAVLALPFLYLTPRNLLPNPAAALFGLGALLLSLGGTVVEVDTADAYVRLRLF